VLNHASKGGLITIFTLAQLFLNMGPNCTTFLMPVELFPTRVRGTAHGIAAASGKLGAVVTAFSFGSLTDAIGLPAVLGILSGVMVLTALCTLLIPETKGCTLDEIEKDMLYGVKLGIDSGLSSTNTSPALEGKTNVLTKGGNNKEVEVV
jgi:MFS transporter, PHS family, inorganic phosphate transporter